MDEPGFHARRRSAKVDVQYEHPKRNEHGRFSPVVIVEPVNEPYFAAGASSTKELPEIPDSNNNLVPFPPTSPSPKKSPSETSHQTQRSDPSRRARYATVDSGYVERKDSPGSPILSAVDRSKQVPHPPKMKPHLQLLAGPLLKYDTVDEQGMWNGACMIVTVDGGSVFDPHPMLSLQWDPEQSVRRVPEAQVRARTVSERVQSVSAHPAGAYHGSPPIGVQPNHANHKNGRPSSVQSQVIPGHEIYVHYGPNGTTYTFWRFLMQIPLGSEEMAIKYRINHGQELEFAVPAVGQNMRWAAYSCNGFSQGVNTEEFCGPGFESGADPLWIDLLEQHMITPFHAMVGGGDQIYCDVLMREPELQEWINLKSNSAKVKYPMTDEVFQAIDRFYFNHYCKVFQYGAFSKANASIPMLNMCDDHDLIDGFGSYPEDLMTSPTFKAIGSRGYFYFLLFQCFVVDSVDGVDPRPGGHTMKSVIIGNPGPYVASPSHSFLTYLGPNVYMLLLDCRGERKKSVILTEGTYNRVFERIRGLPQGVEHLVIQLGVPIAYPRMNFLESTLGSKLNPFLLLAKKGTFGLGSMVNKFNQEAELLDDLNDHWTAKEHKKERNSFVQRCQQLALDRRLRIAYLSGDVHCAAVGVFRTLVPGGKGRTLEPAKDHRYMLNVVSSAIVNTPPPDGVISLVSYLATKKHKTMHHAQTDETMIPVFAKDTDGKPAKHKYIMGRRNWCSGQYDEKVGVLTFDIRVEEAQGIGKTIGYPVRSPPPAWDY